MNCNCPSTLVPTPVGMKRKRFLPGRWACATPVRLRPVRFFPLLFRNKLLGQLELPSAMLRYLVKGEFTHSRVYVSLYLFN
jgi:hypothetical protein